VLVGYTGAEINLFRPYPYYGGVLESLVPLSDARLKQRAFKLLGPSRFGALKGTQAPPSRPSSKQKAKKGSSAAAAGGQLQPSATDHIYLDQLLNQMRADSEPANRTRNEALYNQLLTNVYFGAPALLLAAAASRHSDCYSYRFEYNAGSLGAAHAAELTLLFGTYRLAKPLEYMSGYRQTYVHI
jgi:hypothetical protein